jgi:hypothetical protein
MSNETNHEQTAGCDLYNSFYIHIRMILDTCQWPHSDVTGMMVSTENIHKWQEISTYWQVSELS